MLGTRRESDMICTPRDSRKMDGLDLDLVFAEQPDRHSLTSIRASH